MNLNVIKDSLRKIISTDISVLNEMTYSGCYFLRGKSKVVSDGSRTYSIHDKSSKVKIVINLNSVSPDSYDMGFFFVGKQFKSYYHNKNYLNKIKVIENKSTNREFVINFLDIDADYFQCSTMMEIPPKEEIMENVEVLQELCTLSGAETIHIRIYNSIKNVDELLLDLTKEI